jgi:hypothetical protein
MQSESKRSQVLTPKIEISLRQYDWSILWSRSRSLRLQKKNRNIHRPTRPAAPFVLVTVLRSSSRYCTVVPTTYPPSLIAGIRCTTSQCLVSALLWYSTLQADTPPIPYLPSSHLSLKNPSSITWTPQPPKLRLQSTAIYCAWEERTSKIPSKCLASPSGSLVLVYFAET